MGGGITRSFGFSNQVYNVYWSSSRVSEANDTNASPSLERLRLKRG